MKSYLIIGMLIAAGAAILLLAQRRGPLRPGSRWWQSLLFLTGFGVVISLSMGVFAVGLQGLLAGTILVVLTLGLLGALVGALWWLLLAFDSRRRARSEM